MPSSSALPSTLAWITIFLAILCVVLAVEAGFRLAHGEAPALLIKASRWYIGALLWGVSGGVAAGLIVFFYHCRFGPK